MAVVAMTARGTRRILANIQRVLLVGLVVREAFSFWTGHPYDFEVWLRTGHAVALGSNPYIQPWPAIPGVSTAFLNQPLPSAAYPPFWPLLLGGLYRTWESVGRGNPFVLYFLIKQPGILADVLSVYLLYRIVAQWTGDMSRALSAAVFWALFPYAIVITSIWGQFDSIVVVLLLASLLVQGPLRRNVLYGFGVFVKWVTAIFIPLEILRERALRRLGFLLTVAVPVALTGLAFWATHWSVANFTAGGFSQSLGGGYGMNLAYIFSIPQVRGPLSPYPGLYEALSWLYVPGVAVAGWFGSRWITAAGPASQLRPLMLVVTTFLALRWGLYEQYLLYIFVLLAVDVSLAHPTRRRFFLFLYALVSVDLLVNNDFGIRFVSPIVPAVFPFIVGLDSSAIYGVIRFYALLALSVAVTVTLAQLIRAILRDEAEPVPWLVAWLPAILRLKRSGAPP